MQFLVCLLSLVWGSSSGTLLVPYANGAVAPFDPNNAKATAEHLTALAEAGGSVNPLGVHATGVYTGLYTPGAYTGLYSPGVYAAPLPATIYGRRKRSVPLVEYPNGAVAPFDPNVAVATANHYAAKAAAGVYPYAGAESVHPPAASLVYSAPLGYAPYSLSYALQAPVIY